MKEAAKYLPISFPENCMLPTVGFAAMPTQLSLCAISVSSKSCATCRSSVVASSDFPARKIGSCISSLIISFPFHRKRQIQRVRAGYHGEQNCGEYSHLGSGICFIGEYAERVEDTVSDDANNHTF